MGFEFFKTLSHNLFLFEYCSIIFFKLNIKKYNFVINRICLIFFKKYEFFGYFYKKIGVITIKLILLCTVTLYMMKINLSIHLTERLGDCNG